MPTITFEQVNLRYGKQAALRDLSFTIAENTICGLLGRNGAGKTSLLSLLASYRAQSSGRVLLDGEPVFDNPRVTPLIGFVRIRSEEGNSNRVKEELRMAALFRPNWDGDYALKLLDQFGIPLEKRMYKLSLGMQASVRGIIGIASRTPVTLYDEAYLGMDAAIRQRFVREILEDYMRFPRTILFSTHFISEVEKMLETVLVLSEGALLLHEDCDTLRARGAAISGNSSAVDEFCAAFGWKPLSGRTLGGLKEIIIFGEITGEQRTEAARLGLNFSQPPLQELFVHITEKGV
ncbi:ABC transporter [Spirochaetia bacterium]|nr:ABC transporter [Spirochaetia bacterium]